LAAGLNPDLKRTKVAEKPMAGKTARYTLKRLTEDLIVSVATGNAQCVCDKIFI